jgi:two-component system probable response regulator PhcQ
MRLIRIALVDDEPLVLSALTRLLRQGLDMSPTQLSINAFTDPLKALAGLRELAVDLMISDYRMPGLDGVKLLSQMAQIHPDTVRVLLSGTPDLQAVLAAVNEAGVSHVLLKPWDNGELLRVVRTALAERDTRLEQRHLANESRLAKGTLSAGEVERQRLEEKWPGITQVEWTDDGAVQMGDTGLVPLDPPTHNDVH